jgi:alkaline phosphatase
MGFEQVKAGGMYAHGQPGTLSFESFDFRGELTNPPAEGGIPDSAAAGTSLATGVKVNNGVISVAIPGDGSELQTLLEYFKARGKSTGLVSTKYITDATPAAFAAHEPTRMNTAQIAADYRVQTRPNVILGGGGYGMSVQQFQAAGYTVATNRDTMQALDTENIDMVCGQFGNGVLPWEPDMGAMPHLTQMAETALRILDNDPDGFFVMIEGGQIDTAGHSNLTANMVFETVEFDNAVQAAIAWAQGRTDTLIIVTADHETGGLTVLANNGAGVLPTVSWSTKEHSAANVPVYAWGVNADMIGGVMDNTELFGVVTAGPPVCDFNGDGIVNIDDLLILIGHWGTNESTCDVSPALRGDGVVDAADLKVLMSYWDQQIPDPTLIAHWELDETEGNAVRESVSGGHDIVMGSPLWQPTGGQVDGAIQLDGVDDCIIAAFALNPAKGPFSVLAWVKGGAPSQVVVSEPTLANWLMADAEGKLMTELASAGRSGGPLRSQTAITDGQWHRVGLAWDGSRRRLYVDGVVAVEDTQSHLPSSGSGLYFGAGKAMQPGTYWSGLIDEIRIYNRAVHP